MSNLPGKITDTYFSKEEQHTYSRFFKLLLRFLLVTFGGAAFIQIAGSFSLFYFGEFTDLVCHSLRRRHFHLHPDRQGPRVQR